MGLDAYLASRRESAFVWGVHDCALFAAGGVDAQLGTNYTDVVRAYGIRSALAYRRFARRHSLYDLTCEALGQPIQYEPRDGDVGIVDGVLGIVVRPVILLAAPVGYAPVPLGAASAFWRPR